MTLHISSVFTYDEDAGNYIQAVEAADGQALEGATRKAINNFVIGCKQDGIWDAIKASCILAGARTLDGALVPLVGTAPTKFGTEGNWNYNRKTGLQGDGSTNYLNSNRNNNADPQDSNHNAVWLSTYTSGDQYVMGSSFSNGGNFLLARSSFAFFRNRFNGIVGGDSFLATSSEFSGGLFGMSRNSTSSFSVAYRQNSGMVFSSISKASITPLSGDLGVFTRLADNQYSSVRLSFYSIGEYLDLALLDARVTDLITAFGAAIP